MNRPVVISIVIAITMIASAMLLTRLSKPGQAPKTSNSGEPTARNVTASELKAADGQTGHRCYVAVDGKVYEISNEPDWQDGQHTTSAGQAYCGADMSQVIDKAPHGRKILDQLTVIGQLAS